MKINEDYDGASYESSSPYRRYGWDCKADRRYGCAKKLTKHNERWLRSRVGHKWSKIYSELCECYRTPEDRRTLDDCFIWRVEQNATKKDGKFFDSQGNEINHGFVVIDDILYEIKSHRNRKKRQSKNDRRKQYDVVWINRKIFALINNIWYELRLGIIENHHNLPFDMFLKTCYTDHASRQLLYGNGNYYCKEKQQVNSTDLKKLGLALPEGK
jgi:hypothetical protein